MGIFSNFGYKLLSVAIALLIWFVAQGRSDRVQGFDIPVVLSGVPEGLVVTEVSTDAVHVRVAGSTATLRAVHPEALEYAVEVRGAKRGEALFEVDARSLEDDLPRGARIVGRSPSRIEMTFERSVRRELPVRPDLAGEPQAGFQVSSVRVAPSTVEVAGAQPEVWALEDVITETVDISGIRESLEREVRVSPGAGHMWVEGPGEVTLRVDVVPIEGESDEPVADTEQETEAQG